MVSEERLDRRDWTVMTVPLATCQRLVAEHHYARGGSNSATYRHGLFRRDDLLRCWGVAWWIPPTKDAAAASWDGDWRRVLSLSRLAIVPEAPRNAATFLMMASVRLIAAEGKWDCLITYADRAQGHTGAIYRASNWEYMGETKPEQTWVDPRTGRMVARKAGPVTRTREEMRRLGYVEAGKEPKHKFRMVLPTTRRASSPLSLF